MCFFEMILLLNTDFYPLKLINFKNFNTKMINRQLINYIPVNIKLQKPSELRKRCSYNQKSSSEFQKKRVIPTWQ